MAYALDAFGANVTGAWGLRKMLTAFGGNAGQLKRLSDSSTTLIGFNGDGLDRRQAALFHGPLNFNNTIWKTFYDQSGNARDAVNATDEMIAYSMQYRAGAFMGDSLAAIHQNSSQLNVAVGSPVHTALLNDGVGTVLAVVQSHDDQATQNYFADSGGWFGFQFLNAGGVTNWDFTARAWHYNEIGGGTLVNGNEVAVTRYQTNVIAWRVSDTVIDCCVNGTWSAPAASAPTGGSGNNLIFGGGTFGGMTGEFATVNRALTDAEVESWGLEASAYWRGRWPVQGGGFFKRIGAGGGLIG